MPHLNPDHAPPRRIVVFGGVYNNHLSLAATLAEAERRGADEIYCLGDMGGFGPRPDKVFPLLQRAGVRCMQGNYDHSIGNRLEDCACGYTDPRDNHFARISYDYTLARTSDANKDWLRALPTGFRHTWNGRQVVMAHGSTRRTNEFLWASTSPDHFLEHLLRDAEADLLLVTHTGIPWSRTLPSGRTVINVGAIGRPANDGNLNVWAVEIDLTTPSDIRHRFLPISYDHAALADEMRDEQLPEEFVATILTGWWTTCLEILPAKERALGRF
ncbi:MAG: metallophosphoesterase family protein [Deltaproteobacteria bacterium]|nr:metallophosphoesterase family protein [Deltaproteobacteria bacterium]